MARRRLASEDDALSLDGDWIATSNIVAGASSNRTWLRAII